MTDLERRIGATLAERAERTFPVDALRERAVRRAMGVRRRRRVLGAAAAAIVAVAAFVLLSGPHQDPAPGLLPAETGAPPGGVGTDPGLIHFALDSERLPTQLTDRVMEVEWVSGDGYEKLTAVDAGGKVVYQVGLTTREEVAQTMESQVDHGDTRALTWHSGDVYGVAGLRFDDRALLRDLRDAVRTGEVHRCVMPLHLAELPEGARWVECQTRLRVNGPAPTWVYSGLTVRRVDNRGVYIWADGRPQPESSFAPDRTVGGRPAQWLSGPGQSKNGLWINAFGPLQLFVTDFEIGPADWFTPDVGEWYAARITPSTDLNDPASWPRRAVQ